MGAARNGSARNGAAPSGTCNDSALEQAMIERVSMAAPQSGAEALKELRSAYPESPLAQRVAALVMLARRQNGLGPSR
jgi:hypothetical protein